MGWGMRLTKLGKEVNEVGNEVMFGLGKEVDKVGNEVRARAGCTLTEIYFRFLPN